MASLVNGTQTDSKPFQMPSPTIQSRYHPLRYIAPFLICFIFTIGLLGNLCVLFILRRRPRLYYQRIKVHPVVPQMVQSMAMADVILLSLVCPLSALEFTQGTWSIGSAICQVIRPVEYTVQMITAVSLCSISVDACLVIALPERYIPWRSSGKTWLGCLIIWLTSVLCSLPLWLHARTVHTPDGFVFCTIVWPTECGTNCLLYTSLVGFALPLVFTIICILWIVLNSSGAMWRPGTLKSSRSQSEDTKQVIRLLLSLTISFGLLWLPYNIVPFFWSLCSSSSTHNDVSLYITIACYAYSSSCIKPLLYVCHHRFIRNGFVDILPRNPASPEITSIRGSCYRDRVIGAGVLRTNKKKNGAIFWSIHGFPGSVIAVTEDNEVVATIDSKDRRLTV